MVQKYLKLDYMKKIKDTFTTKTIAISFWVLEYNCYSKTL